MQRAAPDQQASSSNTVIGSAISGIEFEAPWINTNTLMVVACCFIDARWITRKVKDNQACRSVIASTEDRKIVAGYI